MPKECKPNNKIQIINWVKDLDGYFSKKDELHKWQMLNPRKIYSKLFTEKKCKYKVQWDSMFYAKNGRTIINVLRSVCQQM